MRKIDFHFHADPTRNNTVIEKTVNGKKKKYLVGVSSGLKEDAHKEKMSENCIKSFFEQGNSQDILLFPDIHGIKQSEDIAILESAKILDNGDWYTEYRLYDEEDDPGQSKLDKINTLWKQANGITPYTRPKKFGFSIEGIINEKDIKMSEQGKRILDNIALDGVILTPCPAYQDSIANAVFKALDELPPWRAEKVEGKIKNKLLDLIAEKDLKNKYWEMKYDINSALQETIEEIMGDFQSMKSDRLEIIFKEYSNAMINLLMKSQEIFQRNSQNEAMQKIIDKNKTKNILYKSLTEELTKYLKYVQRRI